MQEFLVFFGLTEWSTHSVVVGGALLFLFCLFTGFVGYGLYQGIQHWRDCYGQPTVSVVAEVLSKHYTPATSGTRMQYGYGYDVGKGGFGYRLAPTSYNDPARFDVEVRVEGEAACFSVSSEEYHRVQEGASVRVSGRHGKRSGRFYPKDWLGE